MGNCQAVDAAALVIQHPDGKLERMYWPVTASEVMKANPGHYVSLIIPLPPPPASASAAQETSDNKKTAVRFTRVKLLRPSDTLVLGRAYRLVTTQEVMKVLRAKKHAKMKKTVSESGHLGTSEDQIAASENEAGKPAASEKNDQATRPNRQRQRSGSTNIATVRPKLWRPSLQSILESPSRLS
ncbi:uncharacterized protein LOC105168219 [Sesamum indicum]|uniref:Uncharacterized protein LOC105168219 n=1 Tax=Sesamum indicum TaxID=4182 RepID=A0A6I9TLY7_SESIN|nr:uncharacterized protein LOC105168219 [Sesamum indicum]